MYQSERNGPGHFGYFFPGLEDAKYVLILNFVESHHNSKNQRVFNVKLGFSSVIEDLDIFARVGKYSLLTLYIEFEIKNNQVIYNVYL